MKDTRSLLLLLLSICILGTWVYHLYDKNMQAKHPNIVYVRQGPAAITGVEDEPKNSSDTFSGDIDSKMKSILLLRQDIMKILTDSNASRKDLSAAEQKLRFLEADMNVLTSQTDSLIKIKEETAASEVTTSSEPETTKAKEPETTPASKPPAPVVKDGPAGATFISSRLVIKALAQSGEGQWQPTMQAKSTNALGISFSVSNETTSFANTPIYIVLTDPRKNVIQDDLWEGGIISLQNGGIVRFTRKINIEYDKAVPKKVNLTIELPNFTSGHYKVQVYHNNELIGNASLALY